MAEMCNSMMNIERCPGCGAELPVGEGGGPIHGYVDASASCWMLFSNLTSVGEPALAPKVTNSLIVDAYLTHHHGSSSPQAIQSVAVHLLVLYGVLHVGIGPDRALWIRHRATRPERKRKPDRFHWLTPPDWTGCPTLADAVSEQTAARRSERVELYVQTIWERWSRMHLVLLRQWYQENVAM
jgi:Family of unknown function (DUF5946)